MGKLYLQIGEPRLHGKFRCRQFSPCGKPLRDVKEDEFTSVQEPRICDKHQEVAADVLE